MRAVVQRRFGAPDVLRLEEVGAPEPGEDDVLVRVRAASVNPADWHVIRGRPLLVRLAGYGIRRPAHPVPGKDVAGVVEAVGRQVSGFRVGDEVFGWARGSYAELAVAAQDRLATKPDRLTFEEAAAVPLAAVTALQGLRDVGRLRSGASLLVIGASGGVGTFAVQIGRALDATVTGVCSSRNVDLVRSIGADEVIDYTHEDVTRLARRFDVIFQLAGTASPLALRRALRPAGTLVLSSGDGRLNGIDRILLATASSRMVRRRLVSFVASERGSDLAAVKAFIDEGAVTPVIDRCYPLDEIVDAVRYAEAGHTRGKVVLSV